MDLVWNAGKSSFACYWQGFWELLSHIIDANDFSTKCNVFETKITETNNWVTEIHALYSRTQINVMLNIT